MDLHKEYSIPLWDSRRTYMPLNIKQVPFTNFYAEMVATAASFTINSDCNGYLFRYEGSSNITVTVPANLPLGFNCGFAMWGTGTVTLAPGTGATNRSGKTTLNTQYTSGSILIAKNIGGSAAEFLVGGDFQ
jgi:hypothetical protein